MITAKDQLQALFEEINLHLNEKALAFIFGGATMLLTGLKPSTKDIDIATKNKIDFQSLKGACKKIGFKETTLTKGLESLNVSVMLERDHARIDLFSEKICDKLELSNSMIGRAKEIFKGKQLIVYACANEDIFVFKTITDREGDLQDCQELIKFGLNWKTIQNEITMQIKKGQPIWITHINERLLLLEEKGFNIPILEKINEEAIKYYKIN